MLSVGDGIARVHGLKNCKAEEMVEFVGSGLKVRGLVNCYQNAYTVRSARTLKSACVSDYLKILFAYPFGICPVFNQRSFPMSTLSKIVLLVLRAGHGPQLGGRQRRCCHFR